MIDASEPPKLLIIFELIIVIINGESVSIILSGAASAIIPLF
jgi:hypothetical protein